MVNNKYSLPRYLVAGTSAIINLGEAAPAPIVSVMPPPAVYWVPREDDHE